ncbi:efflux RND transporter periplasmic adaptor subunit [Nocardioides nematodiphilus]|uniref:efflux RND transporter periplasmic adaptor subunit n=1 Tax=Nocardioides nematodiphilus TaxID=2849669 RepID=UPI001CDA23C6|nr:HlyD family efflux transporter periplasmic adaptor subunit [Nocardioides nematodiphilus]MCA1984009.1 HlyD family efflux transporter periplasmic adaptor subunit [Nocardioides nematodiphilus]
MVRPGKRGWAILIALLVIVGSGGSWLLLHGDDAATATPLTAQASSGTVKQTVSATGTIEPARTADLDFAVAGTVTKVYVKAGDRVAEGQAIAAVDDSALIASRTAARASYDAALTQHATDVDADASDVQLAADQTAVLSAKAQLDAAIQDVKDAVLRSTIKGTVSSIDLAVGDVVSGSGSSSGGSGSGGAGVSSAASTGSTTSSTAVTVTSTNAFVVSATVSADDAATVKKGMQAQITLTGASAPIYGTVSSVGLVAQTSSSGAAAFPVEIAVTGAQRSVYAGTTATASITVKQTDDVLTVSSRAIRTDAADDNATYVMKMVGGKAVKTPVEVGTVYGSTTEITSGLADGDTVQIPGITIPSGSGSGSGGSRTGNDGGFPGGGLPAGGAFPGGAPGGGQ